MAKRGELKIAKVQKKFNAWINSKNFCEVRDGTLCNGNYQCSHFYPVGGNNAVRFYPMNAHCQCAKHHLIHHTSDPLFYARWMENKYSENDMNKLFVLRKKRIRYTQEVLKMIMHFIDTDDPEKLSEYIEEQAI